MNADLDLDCRMYMTTTTADRMMRDVDEIVVSTKDVDARLGIEKIRELKRKWKRMATMCETLTHEEEAVIDAMQTWYREKSMRNMSHEAYFRRHFENQVNTYREHCLSEHMKVVVFYDELISHAENAIRSLEDALQIGVKHRAKLYMRSIRNARSKYAMKRFLCECGKHVLNGNKHNHEKTAFHKNAVQILKT